MAVVVVSIRVALVVLVASWFLIVRAGPLALETPLSSDAALAAAVDRVAVPWDAPPDPDEVRDEYLAACIAVKNQGLDLAEWLQHHYYAMGFRRFYIMDDGSSPRLSTFAAGWGVPREAVTIVFHPREEHKPAMQFKIYNDCARIWGKHHTWIAFFDTDEFFDTPGGQSIESVLREMEADDTIGSLGVSWQMHTSQGRLTRAPSVRAAYTECISDSDSTTDGAESDNRHVKSIVRVALYEHPNTPHNFATRPGTHMVGEHGDVVDSPWRKPITRDRLSMHHYAVKSRAEFEVKMQRSNAMNDGKTMDFWNHVENFEPKVECAQMRRWVPQEVGVPEEDL